MPVTVVVGGQFGSEGKGKVAYEFAKMQSASIAVRVGGANSGHTVVEPDGTKHVFRHLPSASIIPGMTSVIGPGAYIDADLLVSEIAKYQISPTQLKIHPNAVLIDEQHRELEITDGLRGKIGSTGSGTGGAVLGRISRSVAVSFVESDPRLIQYISDTQSFLRQKLDAGERIVVEGTQGYGLSLLHSHYYPYVTSRDTTASAFLSEAGLSPIDVDDVVMVIRAFPIRVAGNSGPLPKEISWEKLTKISGSERPLHELTTVTQLTRRVAEFDASIVREAISVNCPTKIVMNHLDYVDRTYRAKHAMTSKLLSFISNVEADIERNLDFVGVDPSSLLQADKLVHGNRSVKPNAVE